MDKIFPLHNYPDDKMIGMASLEFEDYALLWWEQLQTTREEIGDAPIDSWEDMKREMRASFEPPHYNRDLFKKLQELRKGIKSVDGYFKEMETSMIGQR